MTAEVEETAPEPRRTYGVVVQRRVRLTTGYAVEAADRSEAQRRAVRLANEGGQPLASLDPAMEPIEVVSVVELDTDAAVDEWAERW